MILDEKQVIRATDILLYEDEIPMLTNEYIIVSDNSFLPSFSNLVQAINILSAYGWETISISPDAPSSMYALVRNSHYKHKNKPKNES